jgi:hypothetical protein
MTNYFDQLSLQVNAAFDAARGDDAKIIDAVAAIEKPAIDDVMTILDLPEVAAKVPELRTKTLKLVAEARLDDPANEDARMFVTGCSCSYLLTELHSVCHAIGGLRIQTRYGLLMDSPGEIAKRARKFPPREDGD